LYKIWWIRMNSRGAICRWKCTFYFHTWISFLKIVVTWTTNMWSASIMRFRYWGTRIKENGALPFWVIIAGWWKVMLLKQNTLTGQKHAVNFSNFLFIFIVHITMIVLLHQKQELTNEF
jgi:hypothetical protein